MWRIGKTAGIPMLTFGIAAVVLVCMSVAAHASGERVALVIGNGAYLNAPALTNPASDARAIATGVRGAGFQTDLRPDLDRKEMSRALREFGEKAEHADVALLFYAGHGLQLARGNSSENYLVPVDARLLDVRDVDDETLSLARVLERLDGAHSRVIILDACRDNPLANQMRGLTGTRSIARGLGRVDAASKGTLLVFSTEPGSLALDGGGGINSPFASALLHHLTTPGLEVRQMFTRVRAEVYRETGGQQTPWSNDGLFDDVFFGKPLANARPSEAVPSHDSRADIDYWLSVEASDDAGKFEAYLTRFPAGIFAARARDRIEKLHTKAEPVRPASLPVETAPVEPAPALVPKPISSQTRPVPEVKQPAPAHPSVAARPVQTFRVPDAPSRAAALDAALARVAN